MLTTKKLYIIFYILALGLSFFLLPPVEAKSQKTVQDTPYAISSLQYDLEELRSLHTEAQSLLDEGMTIDKIEFFFQILEEYALGEEGLKSIISSYENSLDPGNADSSRAINHALEILLTEEKIAICEEAILLRDGTVDPQKIRDRENMTLCFLGLLEVAHQFNSTLAFHCLPHTLEVAILSARGAEPEGFSAMLEAAAEGAYHDSRMFYLAPEGKNRKIGKGATDCEGASGDALVVALEQIRGGQALTEQEMVVRKKRIDRTVPIFATFDPLKSLGTVTNDTMLNNNIADIFLRRDIETHEYKDLDGLANHLRDLSRLYYTGDPSTISTALTEIGRLLALQSEFRVGQADLSEILVAPRKALYAGAFALWIETFWKEAYLLLNLDEDNVEVAAADIEIAVKSFRSWVAMQKFFARGTATFREECNYYPLLAMKDALGRIRKDGEGPCLKELSVLLDRVEAEINTFEKLYCSAEAYSLIDGKWELSTVRREGYNLACALQAWAEEASPQEISEVLRHYYYKRTGRSSPPTPEVVKAFITERLSN